MNVIHNYTKYDQPVDVGVLSEINIKDVTLQAIGEGIIKIISDQDTIMEWTILFTPNSTGTVLSLDNYHRYNLSKYFAFYHVEISNNDGKIGFLDHNERKIEPIQIQQL